MTIRQNQSAEWVRGSIFVLLTLSIPATYIYLLSGFNGFRGICFRDQCRDLIITDIYILVAYVAVTTGEAVSLMQISSQRRRLFSLYLGSIVFLALTGAGMFFFYQFQEGVCHGLGGRGCTRGSLKGVINGSLFMVIIGHVIYCPVAVPLKWFLQTLLFR